MNRLTASRLLIADILAITYQAKDAEILRVKEENRVFRAALKAAEESHENLTRRFWEEVTG